MSRYRPSIKPKPGSIDPHNLAPRRLPGGVVYQPMFWFDGVTLNRDLGAFEKMFMRSAPRTIGVPVTLGAASLFQTYVRMEQKEPKYRLTRKGRRSKARGYSQFIEKNHARPIPNTGYAWWSGTLRRAITARLVSVGKKVVWSATTVDPRKGQPPKWAWWRRGGKRTNVNAYEYARYNEFGTKGRKPRPIFRRAFDKNHRIVMRWMLIKMKKDFAKVLNAHAAGRAARRTRGHYRGFNV